MSATEKTRHDFEKRQTIYMTARDYKSLKLMAAIKDRSQNDLVKEALADLFKKYDLNIGEFLEPEKAA